MKYTNMKKIDYSEINSYPQIEQGSKGYIFLVLIWFAFLLPAKNWGAFPFIVGHTSLSELAIIAMPFVYALYPQNDAIVSNATYSVLRKAILLFFGFSIFINILQYLIYGGSGMDYFRENRPLIPMYVSLILIYLGPRIKSKLFLVNFCLCLTASFIISLSMFLLDIEFTPFFRTDFDKEAYEVISQGRLYNVNGDFAYLSLSLLVGIGIYRKSLKRLWFFPTFILCCLICLIVAYLSFNRTFIFISLFMLLFFSVRFFSMQTNLIVLVCIILAITTMYFAFNLVEPVRTQIENRLVIPSQNREAFFKSFYYGNRDILYMDYSEVINKFFPIGVPPTVSISEKYLRGQIVSQNTSDISLLNVLFRVGIIPLIIYILIWKMFYKYISAMKVSDTKPIGKTLQLSLLYSLPFMALASFNIDLFVSHYSILFIVFFFLSISTYSSDK